MCCWLQLPAPCSGPGRGTSHVERMGFTCKGTQDCGDPPCTFPQEPIEYLQALCRPHHEPPQRIPDPLCLAARFWQCQRHLSLRRPHHKRSLKFAEIPNDLRLEFFVDSTTRSVLTKWDFPCHICGNNHLNSLTAAGRTTSAEKGKMTVATQNYDEQQADMLLRISSSVNKV